MKFTVSKDTLLIAVNTALKGIAASSRLPILSGILLSAKEPYLTLQSTDLEISIQDKIQALIEEEGACVVPGKVFAQIIKSLPDANITFTLEDTVLLIDCERAHFKLNTMSADDFEEFPSYEINTSVQLPSQLLLDMVSKVKKAASTDKNRAILNGILLTVENNTVRLVATDSYRLAIADTNVETSSLESNFELIIPSNVFYDALSLAGEKEDVLIGETSNQIVFTFKNTVYIARKIEGNFPNYKQLIPEESATKLSVSNNDLVDALHRVSVMAGQATPVKFSIDAQNQTLTLYAQTPDQGGAKESIPAEIEGENMDIAFNYSYVQDGLSYKDSESLDLELQSSLRPGIFKSYGAINYLYLVMPVRIN
ncbi:MAG: DNA polymerase III subunit beta [Coriobacteriia bacterium]|nr:DNA polymerase III subunit beta [Coriobacteriia bacterium]